MSSEAGEHLMLWTVRVSVVCYVVALWRWLFFPITPDRLYARFWPAAWLLCVLHVLFAFHFRHQWNHTAALQHTAEMTERVVGLYWGGGLYINYLFLICWGISAGFTLCSDMRPARTIDMALHAFAAFMMFNATAVFGPPWWWIPTIIVAAAIAYGTFKTGRMETED